MLSHDEESRINSQDLRRENFRMSTKNLHFITMIGQPNSGKSSLAGNISQQKTDVNSEADYNQHEKFKFYLNENNQFADAVSKTYLVDIGGLKFGRAKSDIEKAEKLLKYMEELATKIKNSFMEKYQIGKIERCSYAYVVMSSNGNISAETLTIINYLERKSDVWFYVNSRFDERTENSDSENLEIKGIHMKDIYESLSNYRPEFLNRFVKQ